MLYHSVFVWHNTYLENCRDPWWLKTYVGGVVLHVLNRPHVVQQVCVLFLADTLNVCFNMAWIYGVLISNFGIHWHHSRSLWVAQLNTQETKRHWELGTGVRSQLHIIACPYIDMATKFIVFQTGTLILPIYIDTLTASLITQSKLSL